MQDHSAEAEATPPYKAREVAALLGCSTQFVYQLALEDRLDHFRIKGRLFFRRDPVDALLAGEAR